MLDAREDCGVERVEDERVFVGKSVTLSMSTSPVEWVAACADPPRAMSPDRLTQYWLEASLAWLAGCIQRQGIGVGQ